MKTIPLNKNVENSATYLLTKKEIDTLKEDYTELNSLQWNALSILLSNLVEVEAVKETTINKTHFVPFIVSDNESNETIKNVITDRYIYSSPCHSKQCQSIQESISSLISARVLAKAGFSNLAWEVLDTLFDTQGSNGFLPKYRYSTLSSDKYFIPGTDIPSPNLFGKIPSDYKSSHKQNQFYTSGRISSPPFHASIVLDVFYLSNQTYMDVNYLQYFSDKLFDWHTFLHEIVMVGCTQDKKNDWTKHNPSLSNLFVSKSLPCYNIIHPWESMIDSFSPIWDSIFSILHLDPDFNTTISLLECLSNTLDDNENYEQQILQQCPFAMLDVGYASALAKSDESLLEINQILRDINYPKQPTEAKMNQLAQWLNQSQTVLDSLWNDEYNSFLSNLILPNNTKNLPLPIPIVDNFMILYGTKLSSENKANALNYQMLQTEGNFSFNCGTFPLYSRGGCTDIKNNPVLISPMYNYWISKGLDQNHDDALAYYIRKSTINMICNLPNVGATNVSTLCTDQQNFAYSYDARTSQPYTKWTEGTCWNTSTLTAAIVYDILSPDPPFTYVSAPPISNGWVFTLIAIELFIAFSIGVSCIVLSLNLWQRLKDDNEADAFVRFMNYERADITDIYGADHFYGNTNGSIGSDGTDHDYNEVETKISSMSHDNGSPRMFQFLPSFF